MEKWNKEASLCLANVLKILRFEDKTGNLQNFLIAKFARFKRLKNQAIRQLGNQEIRKFSRFGRFNYYIADC